MVIAFKVSVLHRSKQVIDVFLDPTYKMLKKGGITKVLDFLKMDKYFCPKLKNTKLSFFEKNIFLFFQSFQNPTA
jgi:hypothetical protein